MNLYEHAQQFRRELLAGEKEAANRLIQSYGEGWTRIKTRVVQLTLLIKDAEMRGEIPYLSADDLGRVTADNKKRARWLQERERLELLLRQIETEIGQYASLASYSIRLQQQNAILAAQSHAEQLSLFATGAKPEDALRLSANWNRIPTEAAQNLIGFLGDGTPLDRVLHSMAPSAAQNVKDTLLAGILRGRPLRTLGKLIRSEVGAPLTRSLMIARTEIMRAYRTASIENYAANDDVVKGWRWQATLSGRTCAACIALSGKVFPLSAAFGSHPNCRCSPVPVTATWEELGFADGSEPNPGPTGEQWFQDQPPSTQIDILGPAKYAAYRKGEFTLSDLIGYRNDPDWGPVRWERSLRNIQRQQAA